MNDNTNQVHPRYAVIYLCLKLLFCIALVAGVTFLSWHFNTPKLMWWYLLAVFAYFGV